MTHNNMNIQGQLFHHADAAIVANREALESMRKVITTLLDSPKDEKKLGFVNAFDSAGEGFKLYIELVESEEVFQKLESPSEKTERREFGRNK